MAENEDGQERTEDPTPKRQRDAKEKGQIPRSRELNTTLSLMGAALGLFVFGGYMGQGLEGVSDFGFRLSREQIFDPNAPVRMLIAAIGQGLKIMLPFGLLMLLITLVSPLLLGGWSFNLAGLAPKLEKIDPLKGMKRIFSTQGLMELAKSLAKVVLVGLVGVVFLWMFMDDIVLLSRVSLDSGIARGIKLFFAAFVMLSAALVLVAAIDVPFQLFSHQKKLRMTKQEVRDEYKETEGKPEVKGRIRQMQREIAQGRMMENVPQADVVVTNPTHFAVALKYDQLKMRAPQVVAKGTDLVAARIRELAKEHGVPLFEAPPLARALYHTTELEREVPAGLYLAVAQVLAYIYQLRQSGARAETRPQRPSPQIPEEFVKYAQRGQENE